MKAFRATHIEDKFVGGGITAEGKWMTKEEPVLVIKIVGDESYLEAIFVRSNDGSMGSAVITAFKNCQPDWGG